MTFTKKRPFLFPLLIYLLAAAVRLAPVIAARHIGIGLDDMFQYDMLGRSLAAGDGFRWYGAADLELVKRYFPLEFVIGTYDPRGILTSFRGPGYPFFLSLIYRLFGLESRFFATRLIQAFILASLAPLGYALTKRLFPQSEAAARTAATALAVYPFLVVYPLAIATEAVFIPLTLAALLVLLRAGEDRRWQSYLLAGILLGAAALTRSVILSVLPAALLWVWLGVKDKKGALVLLASVVVIITPWIVRNSLLHGKLTFIENAMGYTLYMGYHPETNGRFEFGPSLDLMPYLDDSQRNDVGMEKAWGFIRQAPERIPGYMVTKLGDFFGLERRVLTYFYSNNFVGHIPQPWFTLVFITFTLPFTVITCGAVLALTVVRWRLPHLLVAAWFLSYLAPHLLLLAEPRFHLTLVPLLTVFAAYGWTQRRTMLAQLSQPGRRGLMLLALLLVLLLAFNWGSELWQDAAMLRQLFGPEGNQLYLPY